MPVSSVTLPAWVLASAGMMDTPGPRLLEGEQYGINQSAKTREDIRWRTGCGIEWRRDRARCWP